MLQITFRHMDSADSLRTLAEEKFAKLRAHHASPVRCHLVIDRPSTAHSSNYRQFMAHADLSLGREDMRFDAQAAHEEAACAVREVFARIERQVAAHEARR